MNESRALGWVTLLASGFAAVGCIAELGGAAGEENLGRETQAATVGYTPKTDASHKIELKIWRCDPTAASNDPQTECFIPPVDDPDWVMPGSQQLRL